MSTMHTSLQNALARLEAFPNVTIASNGSWLDSEPAGDMED